MKSSAMRKIFLGAAALAGVLLAGCGGGGATNVLTVTLSDSLGGVVVVTQADTITGTVTGPDTVNGAADVTVAFTCTFTTTTTTGTTTTTNKALPCPSDGSLGTLTNVQTTTVVYTAPAQLPDPTMFQGLIIIITGTADANKSKTGALNLALDSGIRVTIAPTSSAIALGEQKLFTATLTTDTVANDVTWGVTNTTVNTGGTPSIANTFNLNTPTCSPGCGSIDSSGNYTAPPALPTNTTVQVFAISKKDTNRVAVATVTLVTGGIIAFNSLWPTIVPQGGSQADIFLNASNLTSQIGVTLNGTAIDAGSNAIKVFFTPSTLAATTGPVSTGARLRLNAQQLATPGTYTVTITPGSSTTQNGTPIATHTFQVVPVRPGLISTLPNDISANAANQTVVVDGGYFGPLGAPIVGVNFNGSAVSLPAPTTSEPRRLIGRIPTAPSIGGQFPLTVTNSRDVTAPGTAYSNIGVLPAYANAGTLTNQLNTTTLPFDTSGKIFAPCVPITGQPSCTTDVNGNTFFRLCVPNPPTVTCAFPATISLGANSKPSAIAVDPVLNIGAITEAGADMVQFMDLGGPTPSSGAPPTAPTLLGAFRTGPAGTPQLPTSVALDRNVCAKGTAADPTTGKCPVGGPFQNIAAVVNYQAQTLAVLTVPTGTLLETIPLNNLVPPSGGTTNSNTSPNPYSVGIDPFTHRALVAFASTNAGFIVNLDPSQSPATCLPGFAPSDGTSYCPVALVELNTGNSPQVAFEPGAHLAYVTPGGAGSLTAVNTTNPSQASLKIASAQRTANIVTVTMAPNTPHNLVPGSEGTVLISGLPLGAGDPTAKPPIAPTSFNGAFSLLGVINNLEFTYAQVGPNDTTTSTAGMQGFLSTATNFLTFSITPTVQGIDINPLTHSAVLADPNASASQITFVDSLDESVSSLNLCNGLNLSSTTVPCTAEVGASAVAFQPFTNTVVSLNASLNQISLLDPSSSQRVTIVPTGQTAATTVSFTPAGGSAVNLNLVGAVAVDSINNLALVVNSGSGTITPLYLANIQPLQIQSVSTPPVDATTGATNPAIIAQTVLIDSATPTQSVSGVQIFGRGFTGSTQVRLDGVPLPASNVVFSAAKPNELDVTIPRTNGTQNILTGPRNFGLDLANPGGVTSNVMDFRVVEAIRIPACAGVPAAPGAVAIADDLVGTGMNFAVVTETACKQAALISLNPDATFATFSTIPTGGTPTGVATIPRFGYAVVANNSDGTASVLDLTKGTRAVATDVSVGTSPTGVAIEQETGLAIVTNTGSNTATVIDLTPLQLATPGTLAPLTTSTGSEPIAVAIDPDRGVNATGLAVVTSVNIASSPASGQLDSVDLSVAAPSFNSVNIGTVGTTPTGIVFDPASLPNRLFYAAESDNNAFVAFNPDTLSASTVQVGINPASIGYNFQTSTIFTVNSTSNTVSVVDSQTFQTKATLGIGGVSLFATAIEPLSNLALIVDQQNNRVLLFPLPH